MISRKTPMRNIFNLRSGFIALLAQSQTLCRPGLPRHKPFIRFGSRLNHFLSERVAVLPYHAAPALVSV